MIERKELTSGEDLAPEKIWLLFKEETFAKLTKVLGESRMRPDLTKSDNSIFS